MLYTVGWCLVLSCGLLNKPSAVNKQTPDLQLFETFDPAAVLVSICTCSCRHLTYSCWMGTWPKLTADLHPSAGHLTCRCWMSTWLKQLAEWLTCSAIWASDLQLSAEHLPCGCSAEQWACQLQLLAGHLTCSCQLSTWPAAVGLEAVGWARSYLQLSAERSYLQLSAERSYLQLSAQRSYLQLSVTQQTRPLMQDWQSMATSTSFPTHPTSAGICVLGKLCTFTVHLKLLEGNKGRRVSKIGRKTVQRKSVPWVYSKPAAIQTGTADCTEERHSVPQDRHPPSSP